MNISEVSKILQIVGWNVGITDTGEGIVFVELTRNIGGEDIFFSLEADKDCEDVLFLDFKKLLEDFDLYEYSRMWVKRGCENNGDSILMECSTLIQIEVLLRQTFEILEYSQRLGMYGALFSYN